MTTQFNYNRQVRKASAKVLIEANVNPREAFNRIREVLPYLFATKKEIQEVEDSWLQLEIK